MKTNDKKSRVQLKSKVANEPQRTSNTNSSMFKKIRCRFLDRSTGLPVSGVTASLSVAVGDPPNSAQLPVATLCADATGYMSFDLNPLIDLGLVTTSTSGFFISAPKFGLINYDLLRSLVATPHNGETITDKEKDKDKDKDKEVTLSDASVGEEMMMHIGTSISTKNEKVACIVFPVYLENRLQGVDPIKDAGCEPTRIPAIQSPDICDYKASPFSFVTPAALRLGNDCCETLLPSTLPLQQYRFYKVVVRQNETDVPDMATHSAEKYEVDVSGALVSQKAGIKFGEILEYRQEWYSLGHSLGEIKYSLPLAPGESTQLSVIEWSRDDLASRTDKIKATEFLDHDSRRDRAIEETVDAALKEEQGGNSHFGGTTGTASGQTYGTGTWTGNHAFGGGISYSYGNKDVEGDTLQDIHDRVRQASSYVRSLNSTVIVQGSQRENNALQTRKVANHNHCHALTIQYYEVLRHYRMVTKFAGHRQAVLIPFKLFALKTWEMALRFRTVLEATLLDPTLVDCFEALVRLNVAPKEIYDARKPATHVAGDAGGTNPETKEVEKAVEVKGDKEPGVDTGIKILKGDNFTMNASGLLAIHTGGLSNYGHGGFGIGGIGDGRIAQVGGNYPFIAPGLREHSLIYKIGTTGEWRQGPIQPNINMQVTADRDGDIILNVNSMSGLFQVVTASVWYVNLKYPIHEDKLTSTDQSKEDAMEVFTYFKSDDQLCSARLLRHLQVNQGYYNSAVWMLMDSVERRLYIEGALKDRPDILYGLDDKPLAISGNYVAFQYSDPADRISESVEVEGMIEPGSLHEDIVTLPTRGLFAEAQMGHCNSCEKRDVTRNSDWTEMTVETPPEISGITPGPKGTAPIIAQGQLPGNVIQIIQPQNAPDPTGLANALTVLKTPDIFRDMAGLDTVSKLLGEMVKDATDGNIKAMAGQAQAEIAKIQANGKKEASTDGTTTGNQTPEERYDNLQVAKEVANAADELGLTDQQTTDLAQDIIGGGGGFYSTIRGIVEDTIKGSTADGGTATTYKYWTKQNEPRIVEIAGYDFKFTPTGDGSSGTVKGDSILTGSHTGTYKLQANEPGNFVMEIKIGADAKHNEDIDATLAIRDGSATLTGTLKGEGLGSNGITARVQGIGSKAIPFKVDFTGGTLQWF